MSEYIDNQTQRKETLKKVVRELHQGKTVEDVRDEFASLLRDVGASEIAEIEQALMDEGVPEDEIKRLCDVHVAVFRDSLDIQPLPETLPGHPVHTFRAENAAAAEVLDALGAAIVDSQWDQALVHLKELQQYDRHYSRKENILFPYLERHGFTGPTSVMWAIHDDIRASWKQLEVQLSACLDEDPVTFTSQVNQDFDPLNTAIREMFYKEENILLPTSLEKLSAEEWGEIRAQEPEIGYAFVEPGDIWQSGKFDQESQSRLLSEQAAAGEGVLPLQTGALTLKEINALIAHLPLDITYVDSNDTVKFFSETPDRVFPRTPAIIGRKVQACHPPTSVHLVQQILDDFRAGDRDVAEFWIQMQGKFIHIQYFALRDEQGEYQGTLEVTQDATKIRGLKGERRLLDEGE